MALTGVHVACGYVGATGGKLVIQSLARAPHWSETFPSAASGVTTHVAPGVDGDLGSPSYEIRAGFDIWVAIGSAPDASQAIGNSLSTARIFVPANETRNIFSRAGDKLAWVQA